LLACITNSFAFTNSFLKPVEKSAVPVLEEHDEREGEEDEQGDPKQTAEQGHATDGNLLACAVNVRDGRQSSN
jgi:hypothetical protein